MLVLAREQKSVPKVRYSVAASLPRGPDVLDTNVEPRARAGNRRPVADDSLQIAEDP